MTYDPTNLPDTDILRSLILGDIDLGNDGHDALNASERAVVDEIGRLYAHCLIRDEVERRAQRERDTEVEQNREHARVVIREYFADPTRDNREAAKEAAYRFGWKHSQAANDAYDKIVGKSDPRADFTATAVYARWFRDYVEPEWRKLAEEPTSTPETQP